MKILCLHGAGGNVDTFQKQTWELREALSPGDDVSFHFAQGIFDCRLSKSAMEMAGLDVAGEPPHTRYFNTDASTFEDVIRNFAMALSEPSLAEESPELLLRRMWPVEYPEGAWCGEIALDYLHAFTCEEGPFDGILGLSEGASAAATLLLDELQRSRMYQSSSLVKFAIFLSGAPAFTLDGKRAALFDEVGRIIDIPTLHMVGQSDPLRPAAMALYNTCNDAKSKLVIQTGGHRSPREPEVIESIVAFIRENRPA